MSADSLTAGIKKKALSDIFWKKKKLNKEQGEVAKEKKNLKIKIKNLPPPWGKGAWFSGAGQTYVAPIHFSSVESQILILKCRKKLTRS